MGIKNPFLIAFVLAILCHCGALYLLSFSFRTNEVSQRPPISFLGSILPKHDLVVSESSKETYPTADSYKTFFSKNALDAKVNIQSISFLKPSFTDPTDSKGKIPFKPPKDFFITPAIKQELPSLRELGVEASVPPRTPLKLDVK